METRMWSYRMTYDTMFAPNPFFGLLTLATCKPMIRRSQNNEKGMWIAGWTACTIHNADKSITRSEKGKEKLVYLAQIDDIIPLDDYWEKYPEKRPNLALGEGDASYYGDNIYSTGYTDANGNIIPHANCGNHEGISSAQRDYHRGKNVLICKRFYYFTPEKRISNIPSEFQILIHPGKGQSIKKGEIVDRFIKFITDCATEDGVQDGIVGELHVTRSSAVKKPNNEEATSNGRNKSSHRKGCSK